MQSEMDAAASLRKDHHNFMDLFAKFDSTENSLEKEKIVSVLAFELKVHCALEEKYFYPAVQNDPGHTSPLVEEAIDEDKQIRLSITELQRMCGNEENYDAAVRQLKSLVLEHIRTEEKILKHASDMKIDMVALGDLLIQKRMEYSFENEKRNTDNPSYH